MSVLSPSAAEAALYANKDSNLARRPAALAFGRPSGSQEDEQANSMFRPSKSGKQLQLDPRLSDPLDTTDSSTVVEWEREPILNLVTAVLGAGVLGFPFCFRTCGLLLAVLLVLVTLAAAELSMRLLLISSQLTGKRSYEELARASFGRLGQWAVDLSIIAMNVGSVVAYLNILTDTISSVAGTVIPPGAEPSRNMMLGVVTMAGCLPVALFVRSGPLLNAVNSVSMVFLLFFCCCIALLPFSPTPNSGELAWWRWEGVLVAFPIVSYGFTAHQYLFQIYPASQRPSMKKMTTAVQRGMLLSALIYMVVGACGYGAFGERTAGDVLRNFGGVGAHGVRLQAERVLKYGFGVSLLGVIPLTVVPLHTTFAPWLALCSPSFGATAKQAEAAGLGPLGAQLSPVQASMLTTAILGASCAMAVLLPNVEFVFGLAGSTASTLMAFIMPAAIFLNVTSGQRGLLGHSVDMLRGTGTLRQRRRMAGALLLFGCLAGVLCTHALVKSIQEEHEVVQLAQELVREETKVAVATQTEAKAKQVAEAVGAVVRAAQEVETAQVEASGQAEKLVMAAQALNSSGTAGGGTKKERQQQKKAASSELKKAHTEVDKAVQKLENVTASLGATASRMRNETATNKAAAAAAAMTGGSAGASAAAQQQQQVQQAQQQQQQQLQLVAQLKQQEGEQQLGGEKKKVEVGGGSSDAEGPDAAGGEGSPGGGGGGIGDQATGSGSAANSSSSSAGSAAHTGVVRAAEAAVAKLHSAVGKDSPPGGGDDDVAEALEMVASSANDTLTAVKQSKVALEAASEASTRKGRAKVGELDKAISSALNATAAAAAKLNATAAALKAMEKEKTSELLTMVTKLAAEEEKEEAKEAKQAKDQAAKQQREQYGLLGRKDGSFTAVTATGEGGAGDSATGGADLAAPAAAGAAGAAAAGSPGPQAAAAAGAAGGNATVNGTIAGSLKPRQEVREALKQAAAAAVAAELVAAAGGDANLTAVVNVTQMAQAAIDAASTVVASSKANVEQAIEKKRPKVTVRAIEIAKELHAGSAGAAAASSDSSSGNSTSSSNGKVISVIDVAAEKHEELVSRQQQDAPPPNAAAAGPAAAADSMAEGEDDSDEDTAAATAAR